MTKCVIRLKTKTTMPSARSSTNVNGAISPEIAVHRLIRGRLRRLGATLFIVALIALSAFRTYAEARQPAETASLEVSVRTKERLPLAGARVYAQPTNRPAKGRLASVETDPSGIAKLTDLEPGLYRVSAFKEDAGYPDPFFAFYTKPGNDTETVQARPNETVKVAVTLGDPAGRLTVDVLDAATEESLVSEAALIISQRDEPSRSITLRAGDLSILVPSNVPLTLKLTCNTYEEWTYQDPTTGLHELTIAPGTGLRLTVRLQRVPKQRDDSHRHRARIQPDAGHDRVRRSFGSDL